MLQNTCWGNPKRFSGKKTFEMYAYFHKRLYNYIDKEMGYSYATRMVDSLSIIVPEPKGLSGLHKKTWMLTEQTKVRIREFMQKLEG